MTRQWSLRRQVTDNDGFLTDVYRTGGRLADQAIDDTLSYADPQTAVALVAPTGAKCEAIRCRSSAAVPPGRLSQRDFPSPRTTQPAPAQIVISRLADGEWLVSGRLVGEGLAFRAGSSARCFSHSSSPGSSVSPAAWCLPIMYRANRQHRQGRQSHHASGQGRVPLSGAGNTFVGSACRSTRCSTASAR